MAKPSRGILCGLHKFYSWKPAPESPFCFRGHDRLLSSRHPSSDLAVMLFPHPEIWRRGYSSWLFPRPTSQSGTFSRPLLPNRKSCAGNPNYPKGNSSYTIYRSGFSDSRLLKTEASVKLKSLGFGIKGLGRISESGPKCRCFSSKSSNYDKFSEVFKKSMADKPISAVKSAASRYREVVGLQIEAFWRRNYMVVVGAGAVVLCILLYRIMYGIASLFVGLSEGIAKYGFLALAAAMVAFSGMYVRARFTVNPDKVYRMAMRKLNTSAPVLEVMGAPLTGTQARAYVMSGGGPRLKDFKLRLDGKRCFLIFPIRGSERRGLVSVEVKKKKGEYDMRLLAVDIPMAAGPDQRLYVIGDEHEYTIGGGLISELRDPIVKAMAAEKEFDALDQEEEEEDERREREEAERRQREEEEQVLEEERRKREEERIQEEERKRREAESLEKVGS